MIGFLISNWRSLGTIGATLAAAYILHTISVPFISKAGYKQGYETCQADGVILATEAGRQLNEILTKPITPSDTNKLLLINGWLRDESDK